MEFLHLQVASPGGYPPVRRSAMKTSAGDPEGRSSPVPNAEPTKPKALRTPPLLRLLSCPVFEGRSLSTLSCLKEKDSESPVSGTTLQKMYQMSGIFPHRSLAVLVPRAAAGRTDKKECVQAVCSCVRRAACRNLRRQCRSLRRWHLPSVYCVRRRRAVSRIKVHVQYVALILHIQLDVSSIEHGCQFTKTILLATVGASSSRTHEEKLRCPRRKLKIATVEIECFRSRLS